MGGADLLGANPRLGLKDSLLRIEMAIGEKGLPGLGGFGNPLSDKEMSIRKSCCKSFIALGGGCSHILEALGGPGGGCNSRRGLFATRAFSPVRVNGRGPSSDTQFATAGCRFLFF
jgi:hypothetical protein